MDVNNNLNIGNKVLSYSNPEQGRLAKGSAKPEKIDHVNGFLSDAEIETKKLNEAERSLKFKETRLENQVAVSEDGDTLQISEGASLRYRKEANAVSERNQKIKGKETSKAEKEEALAKERKLRQIKEERKEAEQKKILTEDRNKIKESQEKKRQEILKEILNPEKKEDEVSTVSFAGKSDSDIAKLYLKGDITKAEYDNEIEAREKKREYLDEKESEFYGLVVEGFAKSEEMNRFELEIEKAFSDHSSSLLSPTDRLATIEAAGGNTEEKEEREIKFSVR